MIVGILKLKGAPNVSTRAEDFRIYPGSVMAADGVPYDPFSGVERRPGAHRCKVDVVACKGQLTAQGAHCEFDWDVGLGLVDKFYFELKAKAFRWEEMDAPLSIDAAAFRDMVRLKKAESRTGFTSPITHPGLMPARPVLKRDSFAIQIIEDEVLFEKLRNEIRDGRSKGLFFEAKDPRWAKPLTGFFFEGNDPSMILLLRPGQTKTAILEAARSVFVELLLGEFESQPIR